MLWEGLSATTKLHRCCLARHLYMGWSDIIVISGHITISVLWGNMAYCVKLSGEDLSRYSNKIESVGSFKVFVLSLSYGVTITNVSQSLPHILAEKTAGIGMAWRSYVTVTLCIYVADDVNVVSGSGCRLLPLTCVIPRTRSSFGDWTLHVASPRVWSGLPWYLQEDI